MRALTINDLAKYILKELDKGHGDYTVFVTDDEEGNGYHALWYAGETPDTMSKTTREFYEDNNHDLSVLENKDKAYYIG